MKTNKYSLTKVIIMALFRIVVLVIVAVFFFIQAYAILNRKEGGAPLPHLFGNFPENRAFLEKQDYKDEFSFAVIGDTKSIGTFERIIHDLRNMPLDFAVLLGDCSYNGTVEDHRYFRAECAEEYAMPFPVFYVVGNHDVSIDGFPISRFEQDYGPSIFSFEYQKCLFIVLRVVDLPFTNEESLEFLKQFKSRHLKKYRYRFVFMHVPPPVSSDFISRRFAEDAEMVELFNKNGVDYVFAGDYHGYARVKLDDTVYVVSGGGGARLKKEKGTQFHHAVIMRVGKDSVAEKFVYVPKVNDLMDALERLAIVEVWPWMSRHRKTTIIIDVLGLMIVLACLGPVMFRKKS